ncbi:MAG: transporter permease [Deltaproteobacteria bacterium]|nr:transporter permease [Deltaproteobacteria bacterium]
MLAFLCKRILILIATLFLVSGVIFLVLRVIPGDPAQIILGIQATPEALQELRHKLGLDLPLIVQYANWLGGLFRGDFGQSIAYDVPITSLILSRLEVTVPLAFLSILFAVLFSIPLGIYAATRRNHLGDYGVMLFSQIGLAIPQFWAGILLILFFSVHLQWFAAGGFKPWADSPFLALKSLLLPALSLGIIRAAVLARLTRSCMLETLGEDYIRTARAKGLAEKVVVYKHGFRNALIPVITILGLQMGELLAGAIVIENVFHLPGLGRLVFLAIGQRDLPVVQGVGLLIAFFIVVMNFLVDISYGVVDPRIRGGEEGA